MANAIDVAQHLLLLAAAEDEPDFLTHLRLQKLLYYSQGWSLALRNAELFPERIEAWAHGPVVPAICPKFADYGFQSIPSQTALDAKPLSDDEQAFVRSIWDAYKGFSATKLREKTHAEEPWIATRGSLGPADRCTREITKDLMKSYFSKIATA